jgi:hypothetical protein
MFQRSRMHWYLISLLCLAVTAGCSDSKSPFAKKEGTAGSDKNKKTPTDPGNQNPAWAYDAPSYMRPAAELTAEAKSKPADPLHFFTREKVVSIRRPGGYNPENAPRVAVYWTDSNGFRWNKAGYFGREQTFFSFHVEEDGDYGIRFVGPGQEPANETPAYPELVYHVDTAPPDVEISIEPAQSWYTPGQSVTVSWQARDYHLIENPVSILMLLDLTANNPKPIEIKRGLSDEGTFTYEIPAETVDHEIRFRVEALDRAANVGLATSFALQIVNEAPSDDAGNMDEIALKTGESAQVAAVDPPSQQRKEIAEEKSAPVYPPQSPRAPLTRQSIATVQEELLDDEPDPDTADTKVADVEPSEPERVAVAPRNESPKQNPVETQMAIRKARESVVQTLESLAHHVLTDSATSLPPQDRARDALPMDDAPDASTLEQLATISSKPVANPSSDRNEGIPPIWLEERRAPKPATKSSVTEADAEAYAVAIFSDPLVVPLPATMDAAEYDARWNIAHPWRLLGNIVDSSRRCIWVLPQMDAERLDRIFSSPGANATAQDDDSAEIEALVGVPDEIPEPPNTP